MATMQPSAFGELLRRYRVAAGLSQEALAEQARLSARAISDLERGTRRVPRNDTIRLLMAALRLSPQERAALEAAVERRRGPRASPLAHGTPPSPAVAPRSPFVGRTRELALLDRHLGPEGLPVLLLAGEPGMGKTRLLQEAVPRARGWGWSVLEGGCQRRGGQEPYAPVLDALKHYIRSLVPIRLRADLRGCAWLVRLLPELAEGPIEPLPAWTLPPEQERRLMFEAVERFLANVAGPRGTLLVLDDLQWASPDALDLLRTLARSAADTALRVVGAYRETEVQPRDPLAVLRADLAQAELATHLALGPLAPGEAADLLDGLLADVSAAQVGLRERVLQRAGGVPFFLISCVRGVHSGAMAAVGADSVPWDVAQGVRQRVAALPEVAQEVLGVAAVAGRLVPRAVLATSAERPEQEVLAALEAACRACLLDEEEGADAYRFAHDVIREVVEADLGAGRRRVLHRRIAAALEQGWVPASGRRDPPLEALAYHYARSDVVDKAVLYLEQAGDQARTQAALATAEGCYQELVDRLEGMELLLEAARVREKLGAVLDMLGRSDAALSVLERAVETYRTVGERDGLLRTLAQIGWIHAIRGTVEEGLGRLLPLLETSGASEPSPGLAALYVALACLFHHSARYRECLAASEQAAELARAVADDWTLGQAVHERGNALMMQGRLEEALPVLEEGLRLTETVGDLLYHYLALDSLAEAYLHRGEFDSSSRYLVRALEVVEQLGGNVEVAYVTGIRGAIAFFRGDWTQARVDIERAVAGCRQIEASYMAAYPLSELGWLCLAEGRWDEASRYLDEASAVATPSGDLQALRWAGRALAERDLLEGCPAAARARLVPLLDRTGLGEHDVTLLVPLLAWAYLELGDVDRAGEVAAQAIVRARTQHNRLALVDALRVQAMVTTRQEHWEETERSLEEGLALARSMPYPYAEGRLLHVYGDMHLQKGEPGPARGPLEAALAIFRRLGARKDAERVEQTLATLHNAPPREAAVLAQPSLPVRQGVVPGAPAGRGSSRTERQAWAMEHLRTTGPLSPRAYATALAVSVDTALRDLQELVDRGLVQATGTTRDRRYVLAGEDLARAIHRTAP